MWKNKLTLLMPGLLLGVSVLAAETATEAASVNTSSNSAVRNPDNICSTCKSDKDYPVKRTDLERKDLERDVNRLIEGKNLGLHQIRNIVLKNCQSAREAADAGRYDEAVEIYRKTKELITKSGFTGSIFMNGIKKCENGIETCYSLKADEAIRQAKKKNNSGDYEAAVKILEEAKKYCPARRDELSRMIAYFESRHETALLNEESEPDKVIPDLKDQEYKVQLMIEQGRALLRKNLLIQAKRKFEEVLLVDPFNADADQALLNINRRINEDAALRAMATHRKMVSQVHWAGAVPIVPVTENTDTANELETVQVKVEVNELEKRLRNTPVKNFEIVADTEVLSEVIAKLREYSKDKKVQGDRGVNFIIKEKAQKSESDTMGEMSLKDTTVYDILVALQKQGQLTFKIDKSAVYVAGKGVNLEKMVVRIFPYIISTDDTEETLKNNLESCGISFPEGSSVIPVASRNHLVIKNTPENLKAVPAALQELSVPKPMVQIMFKFLEVDQNDLDELAFNWAYSSGANSHITVNENSNALMRHYDAADGADAFSGDFVPGNADDATLNFHWNDSRNNLDFQLYALDWADSTDILYSPRVTTLSGTTAKIDMTEKHYYPDEWEDIDTESDENVRVEVPSPQPDLSDEQDLGVKFEITPMVNNRLIQAKVNIPIRQFSGWLISDTRVSSEGSDDTDGEYIKKPIFNDRIVNTNVTLKDGQTVLIGSVQQDKSVSMDDRIPILADIPFIGRFFQSKATNSMKMNLLIFMTCRLVKPDGSALYPDANASNRGVATFPRNM